MRPTSRSSFQLKLAERVFWTFVQAGLAGITVEAFDLPPAWLPVLAGALAVLKGFAATKVGDPNSPATLPAGV
jgi:hypothetical protein